MTKINLMALLLFVGGLAGGPAQAQGPLQAPSTHSTWLVMAQAPCNRERGHVKWFDAGRGYGIITPHRCPSEPCHEVQVHHSDLRSSAGLTEGQEVCYSLGERSGLPYAYDVVVIAW